MEIYHGGHGERSCDAGRGELGLLEEVSDAENRTRDASNGYPLLTKAHLVGPHDPGDEGGGEAVKRHECRVNSPLPGHDTGIEDDEARYAL